MSEAQNALGVGSTEWHNPTKKDVVIGIFTGTGIRHRVVVPAGETRFIPTEHDRAVHDVRGGVVVGGLAPQLVRVDGPPTKVHSAIVEAAAPKPPAFDGAAVAAAERRALLLEEQVQRLLQAGEEDRLGRADERTEERAERARIQERADRLEAELSALRTAQAGSSPPAASAVPQPAPAQQPVPAQPAKARG